MSDDDLENDELEVGDEDDTEEGLEAAAEDVADDDGGDDVPECAPFRMLHKPCFPFAVHIRMRPDALCRPCPSRRSGRA